MPVRDGQKTQHTHQHGETGTAGGEEAEPARGDPRPAQCSGGRPALGHAGEFCGDRHEPSFAVEQIIAPSTAGERRAMTGASPTDGVRDLDVTRRAWVIGKRFIACSFHYGGKGTVTAR